tara:strand:+ start:3637 stop:4617 length:981 start_codon:yes stop_codon:yes gene_type:complete
LNQLERSQSIVDALSFGDEVRFEDYFSPEEESKIKDSKVFRQDVVDSILNPHSAKGLLLPWKKTIDFRIRKGETTVHTGYNGHRKSMMLGVIQLGLMTQGGKCLTISLEMPPVKTIRRQIAQHSGIGINDYGVKDTDSFYNFVSDNHLIYDQIGTMKWKKVVGICRYAINNLGAEYLFIDSLLKCGIMKGDYDTQCLFVDELTTLAKDTNTSIHLVAHSKKPSEIKSNNSGENKPPDKYAISGAAEISDMVDNVLIHHKLSPDAVTINDQGNSYDQFIYVGKQRDPQGEDAEPIFGFEFNPMNLQFKSYSNTPKMSPDDWADGNFL